MSEVTLREYIERRLDAHEEAHRREHDARTREYEKAQKAVDLRVELIDERLRELSEARNGLVSRHEFHEVRRLVYIGVGIATAMSLVTSLVVGALVALFVTGGL